MTVIYSDPVPLRVDDEGTIRVGDTRITLDVLLGYLLRGITPEQIISEEWYPALSLGEVYGVLAYYYRHQAELDEYLKSRKENADARRKEIEATQPSFADMKACLQAKRNSAHAPSSD